MSWECFNQFSNYVLHENKIRKNINPENFLWNAKQEFPYQRLKVSLENTTTQKIKSLASSLKLFAPKKVA